MYFDIYFGSYCMVFWTMGVPFSWDIW